MGCCKLYSQDIAKKTTSLPPKKQKDSISLTTKSGEKSIPIVKSETDTIKKDSIQPKAFLEGTVKYKSENYAKIEQKKKQITLYDKAELYYQDIELKAGIIVLNYEKNEVYAGRIKDSTGAYTQFPNFKQGGNVIEPDSIRFNFKTKKPLSGIQEQTKASLKLKRPLQKRKMIRYIS